MAQFDVYENPDQGFTHKVPYVLALQSDLLDNLESTVVAPLWLKTAFSLPISRLTPEFNVEGRQVILSMAELAALPSRLLKPRIASLVDQRDRIVSALDMLFFGF